MGSCIGLATAPVFWVLLVLRMFQAFGCSSAISIGAGVVGDIASPAERGSYFGLFSMGQMLGTVIGPVIGGVISQYLSWRWIFWILFMIGSLSFIVVGLFLPETLRSLVGNGSGYANPTPFQWWNAYHHNKNQPHEDVDDCSTIAHPTTTPTTTKSRFLQAPKVAQPFLYLFEKTLP